MLMTLVNDCVSIVIRPLVTREINQYTALSAWYYHIIRDYYYLVLPLLLLYSYKHHHHGHSWCPEPSQP